eukprot:TRINITY_DN3436_c0_g1_i2.p2 TRINITY_DN3436_c0_g1~~TRINITY_DN3436_c0_g1_i2.p2  ORF type:complete len:133 (+),score=22.41 TRINITY_DN3436_c0_g1_i2:380-778(+)
MVFPQKVLYTMPAKPHRPGGQTVVRQQRFKPAKCMSAMHEVWAGQAVLDVQGSPSLMVLGPHAPVFQLQITGGRVFFLAIVQLPQSRGFPALVLYSPHFPLPNAGQAAAVPITAASATCADKAITARRAAMT